MSFHTLDHLLDQYGYAVVFAGIMLESIGLPLPGESLMIAAAQFPYAVQILDYYHATQHLWSVANAWFGEETLEAKKWMAAREAELKADQVRLVLRAIQEWKPRSAAKRQLRQASTW